MPDNRNRKRPIQVKFFVDEKELNLIKQKMAQMGTENMSAYLRKMAIDGYVVNLDMPEMCIRDRPRGQELHRGDLSGHRTRCLLTLDKKDRKGKCPSDLFYAPSYVVISEKYRARGL